MQPFPANGTKYQVSKDADSHHPIWSPDGKELFYVPGPGAFVGVAVSIRPSFTFGNPASLSANGIGGPPSMVRNYDITPDGKQFIGVVGAAVNSAPQIQVVLNWFEELKQRVPVE